LSFTTSQALPPVTAGWNLLPSNAPLASFEAPDLTIRSSTNLRVSWPPAWLFSPLQGAGLSGLSDLDPSPTPSEDPQVADYFFISKSPGALRPRRSFSLRPMVPLLAEGWTVSRSRSSRRAGPGLQRHVPSAWPDRQSPRAGGSAPHVEGFG
jgi:hypothetical protein